MPQEAQENLDKSSTATAAPLADALKDSAASIATKEAPAAPEKPKSIRAALEKNFSEVEKKEKAADPNAKPEEKTTAQRDRDQTGKFTKKESVDKTTGQPTDTTLGAKDPASAAAQTGSASTTDKKNEPPAFMPKEVREDWDKIPKALQDVIIRRDAEQHRKITTNDDERNFGKSLKEVITPYMPLITSEGSDPQRAVRQLLDTAYRLRNSTPQEKGILLWQLAHQYSADMRIDPQVLKARIAGQAGAPAQAPAQQPVNIENVVQVQLQKAKAQTDIEAFASDSANVHFNKTAINPDTGTEYYPIRESMSVLLKAGKARTLKEAYDKVCWADEEIRSELLAQQEAAKNAETEAQKTERLNQVRAKTNAAKNASASVTGAPGLNGSADNRKKGLTTRQLLERNWNEVVSTQH